MPFTISNKVRVGLSQPLFGKYPVEALRSVHSYLESLSADLRIPASVDFAVEEATVPPGTSFVLWINDRPARIARTTETEFSVDQVLREIYRNRHRLVTDEVTQHLLGIGESQDANLESQDAKVESQDAKVESDDPKVESQDAKVESDDPKVESQDAKVESNDPKVESNDSNSESKETTEKLHCARVLLENLARRNLAINRVSQSQLKTVDQATAPKLLFDICTDDVIGIKVFLEPKQFKRIAEPPPQSNGASGPPAPPWQAVSDRLQQRLFVDSGIVFPGTELKRDYPLAGDTYRIKLNDVSLPVFTVPNKVSFIEHLEENLEESLRFAATSFLTNSAVDRQLDFMEETFPALVKLSREKFKPEFIFGLLQSLAEEEVPIRDLRRTLDALVNTQGVCSADPSEFIIFRADSGSPLWVEPGRPPGDLRLDDYVQQIRAAHRHYFSNEYSELTKSTSDPVGTITMSRTMMAILVEPFVEERLKKGLSEDERNQLIDSIFDVVTKTKASPPVILTAEDMRKTLWSLAHCEFPELVVLSYQELSPDLNILPSDERISID